MIRPAHLSRLLEAHRQRLLSRFELHLLVADAIYVERGVRDLPGDAIGDWNNAGRLISAVLGRSEGL